MDNNSLESFFNERCVWADDLWASSREIYESYLDWVEEEQVPRILPFRALEDYLLARGCSRIVAKKGWRGIGVIPKE